MADRNMAVMQKLMQHSDIAVVVAVVVILTMMVMPLPPFFLDVLLATNISLALLLLLMTMNITDPLQLSVFPSLLLIATLFRLALNISSTRLILLHAFAGRIIQSFGNFVVGGNYVVGFVVFLILVIIQFIVITKGAERVAEVAARFTLDAMPGKQMSIDADLNAGLITEDQARRRRLDIEREADFYGAMDGASKFVKGDAIAGIVITLINILGGFSVGVGQKGMTLAEALQKYTLLTVGDGLVTQIPALLISTATGIIITRTTSEFGMGRDLTHQLLAYPKVLGVGAVILGFFGIIPGLPSLPFFTIAGVMGGISFALTRGQVGKAEETEPESVPGDSAGSDREEVLSLLEVDMLELEIGYSLIPLVDAEQGGDLLDRITMIRRQCALELGIVVPPIRIRDNMQLEPNEYSVKLKGVKIAGGELVLNHFLAMDSGAVSEDEEIDGLATREPAFGLPAMWIKEDDRQRAEMAGYTVVDAPSVLATHLTEVIKASAADLLGRQEVKTLIDSLRDDYPAVIDELIPDLLSLGEVQRVLKNLLEEGIAIRNLVTILEQLADYAVVSKDSDFLTERVREGLARQISAQFAGDDGSIPVITLDPELEQVIREAVVEDESGDRTIALEPEVTSLIVRGIAARIEEAAQSGYQAVVLCSPDVRLALRRLTERVLPNLVILSYNEIARDVEVRSVGMVNLQDEG